MTDKQVNSLIRIFYVVSAIAVLIGAFFRLQHYPNGTTILLIGFVLGTVTTLYDTTRLKKRVKILEEQIKQKH